MAQSRDNQYNTTSPHSSAGGPESFKSTPDTRLTTFSPGDGSAKSSKMIQGYPNASATTPPVGVTGNKYGGPVAQIPGDPFVSPAHGTRLSPTASAFNPDAQVFIGENGRPITGVLSTDIGVTRRIIISSTNAVAGPDVEACLKDLIEQGAKTYSDRKIDTKDGRVSVLFNDIRDACWAITAIRAVKKDWVVVYANNQSVKDTSGHPNQALSQHGQVSVLAAMPPGNSNTNNVGQLTETIPKILQSCGGLFAFVRQITYADGSFRAIAQYCNPADAVRAIQTCTGYTPEGVHLTVTPLAVNISPSDTSSTRDLTEAMQGFSISKSPGNAYQQEGGHVQASPAVSQQVQGQFTPGYPVIMQSPIGPNMQYVLERVPGTGQMAPMGPMTPTYPIMRPVYQTPPSPALTARNDFSPSRSASGGYSRLDSRRQNATRINRSPYHNQSNHHNHVDIGRIRDGIDVRTTIMLRNIPNKVDQAMLKRIIDESSWGKYDFMYLRIDFANDCNVGYAFINFVDPLDIIDFVNARGNQRWNCFKSDKVAEISYATIQGKDCLVQKFRNSSVMLEAPHYRPKLYFTCNGPMPELAGQEEDFPEPDNQSKMKRSCENAEHVGLFTPNAGQHFRDEQRRRRSQYDRGTRLAALEEYDYDNAIQQYYSPGAQ